MSGISLEELFPTDGVVPEGRQIGRGGAIERLTERLVGVRNTLLLEPRRVGKSSVALASLEHCRTDHNAVTFELDLEDGARTPTQIAEEIIRQGKKQGVGKETSKLKARRILKKGGDALKKPGVAAAAQLLGKEELGSIVTSVAEGLSGDKVELEQTLRAVEADAYIAGRPIIALIDEVQALGVWGDAGLYVQELLAAAMKRQQRRLTFVFAGSKRSAVEALFAEGKPLHYAGLHFGLEEIAHEDWLVGLRDRFEEGGYKIKQDLIEDILDASAGHPLRTMQICAHVFEWAQNDPGDEVSGAVILRGVAAAQEHPSWKDAEDG